MTTQGVGLPVPVNRLLSVVVLSDWRELTSLCVPNGSRKHNRDQQRVLMGEPAMFEQFGLAEGSKQSGRPENNTMSIRTEGRLVE